MPHDLLTAIDELRSYELKDVILSTRAWAAWRPIVSPLSWQICHFSKTPATAIPNTKKGVYTFVIQPGIAEHPLCAYLVYVGKAAGRDGFRDRYQKYLKEYKSDHTTRPKIYQMINRWYEHLWFCYAEATDPHIETLEDELLKAFLPPMNTDYPAEISAPMRAF